MKKFKLNITTLTLIMVSVLFAVSSCKTDSVDLTGITLNKATTSISVGANETLSIVFDPIDATDKNLQWYSGNSAVATVNDLGVVTAVSMGTTTISAYAQNNNKIVATCEVTVIPAAGSVITISGEITADQTWYANAKYKLSGFVYVKNNATLTIEPGTLITGVVDSKGTLIIERGSKLMAVGTAAKPIVFTSDKAVGQRDAGDWGGVVLCGKAKTNQTYQGTAGLGQAEGGIGSFYGGTDDSDNSGTLQYVRIEFAGIALTSVANSEINGLTFYAVGNGTTIDHIQVSYSGDDSYEWFGGTVNCKYMIAYSGVDDDFDTDNGFSGTVQFGLGFRNPDYSDIVSKSNGFESDNDANGSLTEPFTRPTFCNMSILGPMASAALPATHYFQSAMHIRRASRLSVYNSVFIGWPSGLRLDGGSGNSPAQADANVLQIENCILANMGDNGDSYYANVSAGYTSAQSQAYFETAARNNVAQTANPYGAFLSLTAPSLLPQAGSILLSGASFTNTRLNGNAFLDKTPTYRGAFGATDWTAGWTNFNPKNTVY